MNDIPRYSNPSPVYDSPEPKSLEFKMLKISDFKDQTLKEIQEKFQFLDFSENAYIRFAKSIIAITNNFCKDRLKSLSETRNSLIEYSKTLLTKDFIKDIDYISLSNILSDDNKATNQETIDSEFIQYYSSFSPSKVLDKAEGASEASNRKSGRIKNCNSYNWVPDLIRKKDFKIIENRKRSRSDYRRPVETGGTIWVCKCGCHNIGDWKVCLGCDSLKPGTYGWACKSCKFFNQNNFSNVCRVCDSEDDTNLNWEDLELNESDSFKYDTVKKELAAKTASSKYSDVWQCQSCRKVNVSNKNTCSYCNNSPSKQLSVQIPIKLNEKTRNFY
jgi:RNA polymerase subunit RPABC4/transcription elongation factor Spt4